MKSYYDLSHARELKKYFPFISLSPIWQQRTAYSRWWHTFKDHCGKLYGLRSTKRKYVVNHSHVNLSINL